MESCPSALPLTPTVRCFAEKQNQEQMQKQVLSQSKFYRLAKVFFLAVVSTGSTYQVLAGFSFSLALVLVFNLSVCKIYSVFPLFVFAIGQSFG
jgi:hypothetical protein